MLITTNIDVFKQNLDYQVQALKELLDNTAQREIAEAFNKTNVDSTSKACIVVASQLGYTELAKELEITYNNDRKEALC